jgi:FtsP/CotA-like multicopper oxidase with cupredoxin domain
MDGTESTQRLVEPGETFEYRFILPDAGTFWYHSHHNETIQLERGLYGALIVLGANNRDCWVSASLVQVTGEISTLPVFTSRLPHSTLYGPPKEVQAVRDGNTVKVAWSRVWMTEDDDRGYLIQASICQAGSLVTVAVHTEDNSYEFNDDQNCSSVSGGKLYTVEKHGYTDPVQIPWP